MVQEVAVIWKDLGGTADAVINDIKSGNNSTTNNFEVHVGNQRETSVTKLSFGEISNRNNSNIIITLQIGKAKSLAEKIRRARKISLKKDLRIYCKVLTV